MKYYGVQIEMNEISKLQYCGFVEEIKDVDTLEEARECAIKVYNDLKNGKSNEYLREHIYRPNNGMCIQRISIHEYDTDDNEYNEYVDSYSFEPYVL